MSRVCYSDCYSDILLLKCFSFYLIRKKLEHAGVSFEQLDRKLSDIYNQCSDNVRLTPPTSPEMFDNDLAILRLWRLDEFTMRDTRKDMGYFNAVITEDSARIEKIQGWIQSGKTPVERIPMMLENIYRIKFSIWIAKYSMGEPVSNLVMPYKQLVSEYLSSFAPELYLDSLWLLSIGILLDVDDEVFTPLASAIGEISDDWIRNYLINSRISSVDYKTCQVLFEVPYLDLKKVVESSENQVADMFKYLTAWYKGHKSAAWYDSHKRNTNTYYGYWSFESGAIAKLLMLDDSALKKSPYYPYDLVRFRRMEES